MRAGDLKHRVIIERPTRATDTRTGERLLTWQTVTTVWAAVWPKSARETEQAEKQTHKTVYDVRMRYTPAVTADCRLKLADGKTLSVTGLMNVDNRNVELRIDAIATSEA